MTAIMMASMGAAALTAAALDTTVTVGNDEWFDTGTEDAFNFGYSAGPGSDTLTDADAMGSIADNTYIDGTSTTRTIHHIYYAEDTGGLASPNLEDTIFFGLVGTSIADSDDTFREIVYNGVTYTRSSRDFYTASVGGDTTVWRWNNVSPNGPTSGVREFKVIL